MRRPLKKIRQRCRSDRGYAAIMTALVLVPLMGFAGFAVDVGAWYAQASALQRAADAASLAGVVWQPDFATAESAARAEAARNGFTHGVDGIEVNVSDTGNSQLEVQIIDTDADMYFAGLFLDNVSIGRQATSEYVTSVPLGSPENRFGSGPDTFGGAVPASEYYAAINGFCTGKEHGDWILSQYIGSNFSDCTTPSGSWGINANYNSTGYWYAIEKPAGLSTDIQVQVKHGGHCAGNAPDPNISGGTFDTVFTLHEADNTPLDDFDNPVYATYTATQGNNCDSALWETYFTIPGAGRSGRWYLNIQQPASGLANGANGYSLFATTGSTTPCSSLVSSSCPRVYAIGNMGIWVQASSANANFYLAEIGDEHAGKQLRLVLWDPGEGMDYMRVLDPNGTAQSFTWTADNELASTSSSGTSACSQNPPCLDVSGSVFNASNVEILIDLPTSGTFATYPNNWWTVDYVSGGGSVTDRTTWTVEILGDPVRLLE